MEENNTLKQDGILGNGKFFDVFMTAMGLFIVGFCTLRVFSPDSTPTQKSDALIILIGAVLIGIYYVGKGIYRSLSNR